MHLYLLRCVKQTGHCSGLCSRHKWGTLTVAGVALEVTELSVFTLSSGLEMGVSHS